MTARDGEASADDLLTTWSPESLFDLGGQVAVVTGAGGGVGRWLAAGLAAAGASLVLTDIDAGLMHTVAERLRERGTEVAEVEADLTQTDAPAEIIASAVERFGRVDVLINNAGANRRMPMLDVDQDTFDLIWQVNFRQPYFLAQAAARHMKDASRGSIINISSANFAMGIDDLSVYGPTKAALSQLTRVMAIEWARFGIRANAIAPGFMDTPMNASHWTHPTRAP